MISTLCEHVLQFLPEYVEPKFVGEMPSLSDEGVAVMLFDGGINTQFFGMRDTLFRPVLKFVIRCADYKKGAAWMQSIKDTFHQFKSDEIVEMTVVGSPMYLGKTEEKLHEFQVTFQTIVKE